MSEVRVEPAKESIKSENGIVSANTAHEQRFPVRDMLPTGKQNAIKKLMKKIMKL